MLRLTLDIKLHGCPCACLGPCNDDDVEPLPNPFYEFYSDVGAKKSVLQTIGEPSGGYPDPTGPGGGYTAGGPSTSYTHTVRVYSYATIGGVRIYSADCLELTAQTNGYNGENRIFWNWQPSATGTEEGYRVLKSTDYPGGEMGFDFFCDVANPGGSGDRTLDDNNPSGIYASGNTVAPTSSTVESAANNGDLVSKLEDQSGNGRHLLQATGAAKPTVNAAAALNGHAPLLFDGVDDFLRTGAWANEDPTTHFAVIKLDTATHSQRMFVSFNAGGTSLGFFVFSGTLRMSGQGTITGPAASTVAPLLLAMRHSKNTADAKLWVNGVAYGPTNFASNSHVELVVGCNYNNGTPAQFSGMKLYHKSVHPGAWTDAQIEAKLALLATHYAL